MIRRLHYCIPVVALSLGLALGMIEPVGALAVLLFAGWLVAQPHIPNSPWLFGTLLGAQLLAAHLLPGFSPLPLNLGITCLVEELIFRGLLQRELVGRFGVVAGIGLATALFGAAHLPAGFGFAGLATLAGLGYGLAFHYSGDRLWVAVLLHGAVNSLHLLLLTYPLP